MRRKYLRTIKRRICHFRWDKQASFLVQKYPIYCTGLQKYNYCLIYSLITFFGQIPQKPQAERLIHMLTYLSPYLSRDLRRFSPCPGGPVASATCEQNQQRSTKGRNLHTPHLDFSYLNHWVSTKNNLNFIINKTNQYQRQLVFPEPNLPSK